MFFLLLIFSLEAYYGPIGIVGIRPESASTNGGETLQISFNATIQYQTGYCKIGHSTIPCTIDEKLMTCKLPKHEAGTFDLRISFDNSDYSLFPRSDFTFVAPQTDDVKSKALFVIIVILFGIVVLTVLCYLFYIPLTHKNGDDADPLLPKQNRK